MKNLHPREKCVISFISCSVLLLSLIISNSGCKKIIPESLPVQVDKFGNRTAQSVATFKVDSAAQLVVWIKPGKTLADYYSWLRNLYSIHGKVTETKIC